MPQPKVVSVISEGDFREYSENYLGWCTACLDWTAEECEPDARYYECPECGKETVHGAEEALLMGYISLGRVH